MIGWAEGTDLDDVVALAIAAKMFAQEDEPFLRASLAEHIASRNPEGPQVIVDRAGPELRGAAFFQPKTSLDGVWDLTMIVVAPELQGTGIGGSLIDFVEARLAERGARLLLVETSSATQYERSRQFYRNHDYDEEAKVRDYWSDGDDLVLFRKRLAGLSGRGTA